MGKCTGRIGAEVFGGVVIKVNYCHECGRHVGRSSVRCWYCQAQVRREIRPERRCPYCDELIRPRAVKCHHCGEFLDGREKVTPLTREAHIEAAIEVEALELEQTDQAVLGGPEVEDEPLPLIGENAAALSRQRRLNPPSDDDPETADAEDAPGGEGEKAESRQLPVHLPRPPAAEPPAHLPAKARPGSGALARSAPRDLPVRRSGGGLLARIFGGGGARAGTPEGDDIIDVETTDEESRYRLCVTCQTEIFAKDDYCYHCGEGQHEGATREWVIQPRSRSAGFTPQFLSLAALLWFLLAPAFLADRLSEGTLLISLPVAALLALVCAGAGLVRGPGLKGRAAALVLLLGAVAAFSALGIGPPIFGERTTAEKEARPAAPDPAPAAVPVSGASGADDD